MTLFNKAKTNTDNPSDLDLEVARAFVEMGTRDGSAPIKAGLARETLISLLFQHADLLAKEGQKQQSATLFEFAMHLSGNQLEKAKTEADFAGLENQAQYLMANGRFVVAATVFETLAAAAPDNQEVHLNLAALYFALDRRIDADNLLVDFFSRQPIELTPADTDGGKKARCCRCPVTTKVTIKSAHERMVRFSATGAVGILCSGICSIQTPMIYIPILYVG